MKSGNDGFSTMMENSGIFFPDDPNLSMLTNPGITVNVESTIIKNAQWAEVKFDVECLNPKNQPWGKMSDFVAYGDGIIQIAEYWAKHPPKCCLGPMRGAAIPASFVSMTSLGRISFDYFNFRNHGGAGREAQILEELKKIFAERNTGGNYFPIGILDCGIGGNGIKKLVELIHMVWNKNSDYQKQWWQLDIHLLIDRRDGTDERAMQGVQRHECVKRGEFEINVMIHNVPKLIVEDYAPAIDFTYDPKSRLYVANSQPGSFLLHEGNRLLTITAPNAHLLYKKFFVEGIRLAFERNPRYRLESVVWKG